MMRWEGGRAWALERLVGSERAAIEIIKWRIENLGMSVREGDKVFGSS
jgi:hypothetical protein